MFATPHPAEWDRPRLRMPRAPVVADRGLRRDLAAAVAEQGFVLHYQPVRALASGERTGAEALIRWPHRRRGLMPSSAFLKLAEESGLAQPIGGWMLAAACATAASWPEALSVRVNLTAGQFTEEGLLGQVAHALDISGLAPERLVLEMDESLLLRADADMLLALAALRDLGVGVVLDEFGTGFASLSALRALPLTGVKLDRSLVRGLPEVAEDAAIAYAVIATCRAIGLGVAADGVETEAQRSLLANWGCSEAQGPLLGGAVQKL